MKTPREVLLNRHKEADAKLDALRAKVLAEEFPQVHAKSGHRSPALPLRIGLKIWLEIIQPYRRAWAGMAVLWLVIWSVNIHLSGDRQVISGQHSASSPDIFQAMEEQRQLLVELIPAGESQPAEPPRRVPQPRSERHTGISIA